MNRIASKVELNVTFTFFKKCDIYIYIFYKNVTFFL